MNLAQLQKAAKAHSAGKGLPPVEQWNPQNCANMQMRILSSGQWLVDGSPIGRPAMVKLFASILRKDEDGKTWLVTPVEKVEVVVDVAHFIAVSVEQAMGRNGPELLFTTNMGDVVRADADHPLQVITDETTLQPLPLLLVRGRLQALLGRPVFYELVALAIERENTLGVESAGEFFALGPKGVHDIGT